MSFSIGRACSDSLALLRERGIALALVAVAISAIMLAALAPFWSQWLTLMQPLADPEAQVARMMEVWPRLMGFNMLANLVQLTGWGTMVALLGADRPSIGPALVAGLKATPTMLVTIIMLAIGFYLALAIAVVLVVAVGAALVAIQGNATGAALGVGIFAGILAYFAAIAGGLYLGLRFVLLSPVVVLERQYNPFAVLKRCWELTRGSGWKIVALWLLLWVPFGFVVGALMLTFAPFLFNPAGGVPPIENLAPLLLLMVPLNLILWVLSVALTVAIHRQLAERPAHTP